MSKEKLIPPSNDPAEHADGGIEVEVEGETKTASDNESETMNSLSDTISCTKISPFTKSNPRHVISGISNGISDLGVGAALGVGMRVICFQHLMHGE